MGASLRNLSSMIALIICFLLQSCLLPSAMMMVGTVYCNTCFQQSSKLIHDLSGLPVSVSVTCDLIGKSKLTFKKQVNTNQHGVFKFPLPLELNGNIKAIKTCSVNLVNQYLCSSTSRPTVLLRLKSRKQGVRVFAFKPLKKPEACNHYVATSQSQVSKRHLLVKHNRVRPALLFPPAIPFLPSPPNVGGVPLPPNPLQPPAPILPPLPFQPPPPPFIGIPPLPSIPPIPSIPPFPVLAPPPPSPPPPFAIPPIPFPPITPPAFTFPPLPTLPLPPPSPGPTPAAALQTVP